MIIEKQQRGEVLYTAGFGPGGTQSLYRYTLRREWTAGLFTGANADKHALFIMLNPSTADATQNDPTVAKCMRFAGAWGFRACEVRNIFALRSTDPMVMYGAVDPVGPENDKAISDAVLDPRAGVIVAAWGNHGKLFKRSGAVREMLKGFAHPVFCFKISLTGEPKHPLYCPERGVMPQDLVRYL